MSNAIARQLVTKAIQEVRNREHRAAISTLSLLDFILEGDDMQKPKVALLLLATGRHIVCDELHPDGRVHILPEAQYGQFDRNTMELDFRKVAQHVLEIVYEGTDWPSGLAKSIRPNAKQVLEYFGVQQ